MKTAISVEDSLMEEADAAAKDLGLSRSGLISAALRDYLRQRRQAQMLAQLNLVYKDGPTAEEKRLIRGLKRKLPVTDRW
jgi:metal-responsive CopG/Arc/MetJ family transcriptional regulator